MLWAAPHSTQPPARRPVCIIKQVLPFPASVALESDGRKRSCMLARLRRTMGTPIQRTRFHRHHRAEQRERLHESCRQEHQSSREHMRSWRKALRERATHGRRCEARCFTADIAKAVARRAAHFLQPAMIFAFFLAIRHTKPCYRTGAVMDAMPGRSAAGRHTLLALLWPVRMSLLWVHVRLGRSFPFCGRLGAETPCHPLPMARMSASLLPPALMVSIACSCCAPRYAFFL